MFFPYVKNKSAMPSVNTYLDSHNIAKVRSVQSEIHDLYQDDVSKYEEDAWN